jgi:hypothetical protein
MLGQHNVLGSMIEAKGKDGAVILLLLGRC